MQVGETTGLELSKNFNMSVDNTLHNSHDQQNNNNIDFITNVGQYIKLVNVR